MVNGTKPLQPILAPCFQQADARAASASGQARRRHCSADFISFRHRCQLNSVEFGSFMLWKRCPSACGWHRRPWHSPGMIAAGHRPTTSMKVEQCQAFRMTCVTGWVYNPVSLFLYPSRNHHVCSIASLAFLGPVPGSATLDRGMRVLQLVAPPGLLRGHWMPPCCTTSRRRAWRPCVRNGPAFPQAWLTGKGFEKALGRLFYASRVSGL